MCALSIHFISCSRSQVRWHNRSRQVQLPQYSRNESNFLSNIVHGANVRLISFIIMYSEHISLPLPFHSHHRRGICVCVYDVQTQFLLERACNFLFSSGPKLQHIFIYSTMLYCMAYLGFPFFTHE